MRALATRGRRGAALVECRGTERQVETCLAATATGRLRRGRASLLVTLVPGASLLQTQHLETRGQRARIDAQQFRRTTATGHAELRLPKRGQHVGTFTAPPLHLRRGLPTASPLADAIFCLQAFHTFGAHGGLLKYLATLLKPGGRLCIAQGCFSEEPGTLGPPFTDTDGWDVRYDTYHSPAWGRTHVESSGAFTVDACHEVIDGDILWEDDVRYRGDRAGWSQDFLARSAWLMRHILHGHSSGHALTHMMLVASRW